LFRRVVHDRAHRPEQRRKDRQPDGLVALGGRDEDGAAPRGARAVVRLVVAVAEKQAEVVVAVVAPEIVHQRRTGRAFRVKPFQLVIERMAPREHTLGAAAEQAWTALVPAAEPPYREAVDRAAAGLANIAPRPGHGRPRRG